MLSFLIFGFLFKFHFEHHNLYCLFVCIKLGIFFSATGSAQCFILRIAGGPKNTQVIDNSSAWRYDKDGMDGMDAAGGRILGSMNFL